MKLEAAIFDMDGLLVDSEPYWRMAEKKVFGALGLKLDDDLLRQVMGFRLSEVVQHWHRYQPWPNPDFVKTEAEVLAEVAQLVVDHAQALPGVFDTIRECKAQGLKLAVASSSAMQLIEAVTDKLGIRHEFEILWSAAYEAYGKPHPGIFLSTAQKLGVAPEACIVFEDSLNGVIAAKAARMYCIAVPEVATANDPRFAIADQKLGSLEEFKLERLLQ